MWPPPKGVYLDTDFNLHYPTDAWHGEQIADDMKPDLASHWRQFPPVNPMYNVFLGVAFFFLLLMSVGGNGTVIYVFLKSSRLRKSASNVFVINLALSDISMMLTHGFPVVINFFYDRYWMWGPFGCKLFAALGGITGTCSIMSMVLIGWDRCRVIVGGISVQRISKGKAGLICIVVWIYCVLASIPPFLGWGNYGLEGFLITCSYDYISTDVMHRTFILYVIITHFWIPMAFVVYFYSQICKAVLSHEAELKKQAKKMGVDSLKQKGSEQSTEVKVAKVAIGNVVLWILTWCPYAIVVMIGLAGRYDMLTPVLVGLPSLLIKTTSSLNPLCFAFAHPVYREELAKYVPCLGIGQRAQADSSKTETVAS